jgi:hypothetical protein
MIVSAFMTAAMMANHGLAVSGVTTILVSSNANTMVLTVPTKAKATTPAKNQRAAFASRSRRGLNGLMFSPSPAAIQLYLSANLQESTCD